MLYNFFLLICIFLFCSTGHAQFFNDLCPSGANTKTEIQSIVDGDKFLKPIDSLPLETSLSPGGKPFVLDAKSRKVYFEINAKLQCSVLELLDRYKMPWISVVLIDPETGAVLSIANSYKQNPDSLNFAIQSRVPAASIFKIVTATAGIEEKGLNNNTIVKFRGGNYVLSDYNYKPDSKKDTRQMSVGEALGKSVNPVFGRLALGYLGADSLEEHAKKFGFNYHISSQIKLEPSIFTKPKTDYELARTGAGFGDVTMSPLHGALIAASLENSGIIIRPRLISTVEAPEGEIIYKSKKDAFGTAISQKNVDELKQIMANSTLTGTAKKYFSGSKYKIYSKTGTLNGENPKGLNRWFIGLFKDPASQKSVAISVLVTDTTARGISGTAVARDVISTFFSPNYEVPSISYASKKPVKSRYTPKKSLGKVYAGKGKSVKKFKKKKKK